MHWRADRRASGKPRRTAGALTAAACAATALWTAAIPPAAASPSAAPPLAAAAPLGAAAAPLSAAASLAASAGSPATVGTVATGPARSLGEPAAAADGSVTAVAATRFGATGARVAVWTRRTGTGAWHQAGLVLPAGFGSSYDASAAAAPGGPLLMVAGTAPPGESCIANGSVTIANVDSRGRLGRARLVSDQRGTGGFDDRPAIAIGQYGTVWVAWSRGPDSDACQNVGTGDRLQVAVSRDGGRTFGVPVTMPAGGGHAAFGARLAPLSGGRVAVSWTETMPGGDEAVLVSVLGPGGRPAQPRQVLTGDGPPLILPGASFYGFPAGDIVALPGDLLVAAAPFWSGGRSVLKLAAGVPGGRWRVSVVRPPGGADLLLPALGGLAAGSVRLLCAVHTRSADRLGYDWADVRVSGQPASLTPGPLTRLTPAPAGPGFFEIGEELSMTPTAGGLLASLVVAGGDGAKLQTAVFKAPRPAAPPPTPPPPATTTPAPATPAARTASASASASAPGPADAPRSAAAGAAAWVAGGASAVACCAVFLGTWRLRRVGRPRRRR